MSFMDYFNLGEVKYKVVFSSSTNNRIQSTTGQLGFYNTKEEAMKDIRKRLPNTIVAIIKAVSGSATLYKKKSTSGRIAKWEKIAKYYVDVKTMKIKKVK